jgi:hypothetical protein
VAEPDKPNPAGTVTISKADLSAIISEQVAAAVAEAQKPVLDMQKTVTALASRAATRPAADVDADLLPRTRGTIVQAEGAVRAQAQVQAFLAFDYRKFLSLAKPFAKAIDTNCKRFGYQQLDAFIQIAHDSGFNPLAVSTAGAEGLAQIMPDNAREWRVDPLDPDAALRALIIHMRQYRVTFTDEIRAGKYPGTNAGPEGVSHAALDLALASWDLGSTKEVENCGGVPPYPETMHYVSMIGGTIRAVLSNSAMRERWIDDWNSLLR